MQIRLYHGSSEEVKNPDISRGRKKVDFGQGFYLTQDKEMAYKWASGKEKAVVNEYTLNTEGLKSVSLKPNRQWINFVGSNRGYNTLKYDVSEWDVIIGPTADDKLFKTLDACFKGEIEIDKAVEILNVVKHSNQVVLKSDKAIKNLEFEKSFELTIEEKKYYSDLSNMERRMALSKIDEILKRHYAFADEDLKQPLYLVEEDKEEDYEER